MFKNCIILYNIYKMTILYRKFCYDKYITNIIVYNIKQLIVFQL